MRSCLAATFCRDDSIKLSVITHHIAAAAEDLLNGINTIGIYAAIQE